MDKPESPVTTELEQLEKDEASEWKINRAEFEQTIDRLSSIEQRLTTIEQTITSQPAPASQPEAEPTAAPELTIISEPPPAPAEGKRKNRKRRLGWKRQ
jgi:hypothetical protein